MMRGDEEDDLKCGFSCLMNDDAAPSKLLPVTSVARGIERCEVQVDLGSKNG